MVNAYKHVHSFELHLHMILSLSQLYVYRNQDEYRKGMQDRDMEGPAQGIPAAAHIANPRADFIPSPFYPPTSTLQFPLP